MGENLEKIEKRIKLETVRTLPPKIENIVKAAAILIGLFEILFIFNFTFSVYSLFEKMGIKLSFLKIDFQDQQVMAFVLGMIFVIAFLRYPMLKREKYLKKVQIIDYLLIILGLAAALYKFWRWPTYMVYYNVNQTDVIFGFLAILLVLEATRRTIGWILPTIVVAFLLYGIRDAGYNWMRIAQYLYLDQGIFGIPYYVMTIYVFAFVFFGAFLLKIGVSDYITEFMITIFGTRPGGPAKSAVISSGLMGTVSGSSVANVLTTGTFTIPLMKKAGYPKEIAGAVEPVASTGGQLMPPVMGAAAFIMAQFLGVPYNKLIIAAVLPALIYYSGVYLFIDLETKRLGLKGMPREHFKPIKYFLRKIYILLPILVITVALIWGIAPHIAAVSSLGVAIWVAWIAKDEIPGNEKLYVAIMLATTLLMFTGRDTMIASTPISKPVGVIVLLLGLLLIILKFTTDMVEFNEKFYISILFILLIALGKLLYMRKEEILLLTGVFGILFSLVVGYRSRTEGGKMMYRATYESMIDAGKTSTTVMLAAASAGLIQGVLTMTGLVTSLGFKLVDIAGGSLLLLLLMAMVFSLILGMGVPTTANYVITSLVAAPAVYTAVQNNPIYSISVPGYTTPVALLAAHFFVFYFGILADLTPPVALAAYAGSALAGGDFWKTAINAVKYALAGYVGPYIYFTHPEMFLITVQHWTPEMALKVIYYLLATVFVMYMMAVGITGHFKGSVPKVFRVLLVVLGVLGATLNHFVIAAGLVLMAGLYVYTGRQKASAS